jgi:hypothetical protein
MRCIAADVWWHWNWAQKPQFPWHLALDRHRPYRSNRSGKKTVASRKEVK